MRLGPFNFALERFGFNVHGLDNGYSGLHNVSFMPQYIKKQINSEANFHFGDITKILNLIMATFL